MSLALKILIGLALGTAAGIALWYVTLWLVERFA